MDIPQCTFRWYNLCADKPALAIPTFLQEPSVASREMKPDPWAEVLIKKTAELGTWTVEGIDLERDQKVWLSLTQPQRDVINRALSRFQHG